RTAAPHTVHHRGELLWNRGGVLPLPGGRAARGARAPARRADRDDGLPQAGSGEGDTDQPGQARDGGGGAAEPPARPLTPMVGTASSGAAPACRRNRGPQSVVDE